MARMSICGRIASRRNRNTSRCSPLAPRIGGSLTGLSVRSLAQPGGSAWRVATDSSSRSPCVHRRSRSSCHCGCHESASTVGPLIPAGYTRLRICMSRFARKLEISLQRSSSVMLPAGFCLPMCTHTGFATAANLDAPTLPSSSTSSTSQPLPRPQGCSPGIGSTFSCSLRSHGPSACGGSDHCHSPSQFRPAGHSTTAVTGPPPA
mmetsp:Transcript_60144/g.154840  ORF Transcript_60144/g.154840 Transcript_60144/m.154840 type:complete len:206 (-) Transcript_60144:243-860(-)